MRLFYLILGAISMVLAAAGAVLPLLPTVPFLLLAAYCFGRGHPPFEAWLLRHPRLGPPILAWRTRGAISRRGKRAALAAFAFSAGIGLLALDLPYALIPAAVAVVGGWWIWTRPDA